jgi:hypothetical protein
VEAYFGGSVFTNVTCKLKKERTKLKLSVKKEFVREKILQAHILKQLFQRSNGTFGFYRHTNPTLQKNLKSHF